MSMLPQKMTPDGIHEALVEVRFKSQAVPELTFAKLLSVAASFAPGSTVERLPLADLPTPIRRGDPALAHQPTMQIRFPNGRLIRLGEDVVSYHALRPYPGWETFQPEIEQAVKMAADRTTGVVITGLGFRYLNLLDPQHAISGFQDLNLLVEVGGRTIKAPMNLNYQMRAKNMTATLRIASPEFVQGNVSRDFKALIDIDVRSHEDDVPQGKDEIIAWIESAHAFLKEQFFSLFKPEVLSKLTAEAR
jgi:uncharacterized protein (TIGR04255 family)